MACGRRCAVAGPTVQRTGPRSFPIASASSVSRAVVVVRHAKDVLETGIPVTPEFLPFDQLEKCRKPDYRHLGGGSRRCDEMSFLFHTSGSEGGRGGQPPRSNRPKSPGGVNSFCSINCTGLVCFPRCVDLFRFLKSAYRPPIPFLRPGSEGQAVAPVP